MSIFDSSLLNGLGGWNCVSDKVDTSRPPGMVAAASTANPPSKQPKIQTLDSNNNSSDDHEKDQRIVNDTRTDGLLVTTRKILTGEAFLYSPNLTWFLMAVSVWYFYPYNLDAISNEQQDISTIMLHIFWERLVVHHVLAMSYISFWHVVLYVYPRVCHRPFVPNRTYNVAKVCHNLFYTWLGVLQWTVTEVAFIYCYKTGRLVCPNVDRNNTFMIYWTTFLVLSILLPSWRDVHFYFCHRLIHLRFLYKYVHGLHHRNTDIEPFSGLCMHPVEHLYYYTCYAPLLVLALPAVASALPVASATAPFLLFWMGLHVVITPAASHSGYEDHFSADLAHYLHHRYCECNYAAGINFDAYFGTYEATLRSTKGKKVEGTTKATVTDAAAPLDPKATLAGWMPENPLYQFGYLSLYAWVFVDAVFGPHKIPPTVAAVLLSFGPALWALVLSLVYRPLKNSWRKLLLAPFDKDSVSSLALHLGLGVALGVLPSTILFYLVLS